MLGWDAGVRLGARVGAETGVEGVEENGITSPPPAPSPSPPEEEEGGVCSKNVPSSGTLSTDAKTDLLAVGSLGARLDCS